MPPVFLVRSAEVLPCPCCQGALGRFGLRRRVFVLGSGEVYRLLIRRLRCSRCHKIHHELPAQLVPYKRYAAAAIEQVVEGWQQPIDVAVDESTLCRWFKWWAPYACGCLGAIGHRLKQSVQASSDLPHAALRDLGRYVGDAPGWLSRAVRSMANAHLWVSTHSA